MPKTAVAATFLVLWLVSAPTNAGAAARCWKLVGSDTFRAQDALVRSQGVTSDGQGWVFSWQGGLERGR